MLERMMYVQERNDAPQPSISRVDADDSPQWDEDASLENRSNFYGYLLFFFFRFMTDRKAKMAQERLGCRNADAAGNQIMKSLKECRELVTEPMRTNETVCQDVG